MAEDLVVMDDFEQYAGLGQDAIKQSDLVMPRLVILQAMSPVVTAEDSNERPGNIYNLLTGENLGKTVEVVLLNYWMNRTKWETPDIGAPIECSAPNGELGDKYGPCDKCQFSKWTGTGKDSEPPACTDFKNLIFLVKPKEGSWSEASWANFAGKRTALKAIDRFLTGVKMAKTAKGTELPIFAGVYEMSAVRKDGASTGAVYYVPDFKRTGYLPKDALPAVHANFLAFNAIRQEAQRVVAQQVNDGGDGEGTTTFDADGAEPLKEDLPY